MKWSLVVVVTDVQVGAVFEQSLNTVELASICRGVEGGDRELSLHVWIRSFIDKFLQAVSVSFMGCPVQSRPGGFFRCAVNTQGLHSPKDG